MAYLLPALYLKNQSGRIGGEVFRHANDSVNGNMTKFRGGVIEMTKRTAIKFCKLKDLAYLFKLKNRRYVCPQHTAMFSGDTFVRKKK